MRHLAALVATLVCATQAKTEDLKVTIPPVMTSLDVHGQAVKLTAWGSVTGPSGGVFRLVLTGDLSGLEDHITPLLGAQLNRSERCGERLTIEHATLAPAAPAAMLTANVHFERWGCVKVFGRDIVKRLVGGNGVVVVKLTPAVGAEGVSLSAEVQKIDADGSLGELLRSGSLGTSLKEKISTSLESAIRKAVNVKSTLPPAIGTAAKLRSVQFSSSPEGHLWLVLDGEVQMPAAQLQALAREMRRH
jgi:hypothetical protein